VIVSKVHRKRIKKRLRKPESGMELARHHINPIELMASLCRDSLYDFVLEFWNVLEPQPFQNNWHVKYLCDEIQTVAERVIRGEPKKYDLIINISPGTTKTTIVSIMLPAWLWTRMPNAAIIAASHCDDSAMEPSRKNRALIKSEKYAACFPDVKITLDQDAKGFFVNTKTGTRYACGIEGGAVTGRHAHIIIIDDPINPRKGRSEADTENANIQIKETLNNRRKDPMVTPIIMIMQRISENDPTGMMLKEWLFPIKHICLPAEITDGINPPELRKYYVNGLMFPNRHTKEYLDSQKTGEFFYAGQYLQSPIPLGGAMFHVERLNIESTPPQKWKMRMRYWDKAGTRDAGAYSVGVLMGKDFEDRFWVLDVVRGQWDSYIREKMIRSVAELDGYGVFVAVEQEPGSGGKDSAETTARNLAGFKVRKDRPTGDKAQRADPFSTQVNAGNVYLIRAEWNRSYIEELRFFSLENSKYKDQVDASSGAFKFVAKPTLKVGGWKV
jgi:predicted phage terminase large subunit-like protein